MIKKALLLLLININILFASTSECKNIFPGALNSTKDNIQLDDGVTVENNNNPLVTKSLETDKNVLCDGQVCSKTNTLVEKKIFSIDTGTGKDGNIKKSFGTLTSSKNYTNVTLEKNSSVGNLKGDITIKIKGKLNFIKGQLKINGNVKIYVGKGVFIKKVAKIKIESGSLEIYSEDNIKMNGKVTGKNSRFILFSKKNIEFNKTPDAKVLIYSDAQVKVAEGVSLKGSITAEEIRLYQNASIKYDEDAVDGFCGVTKNQNTCKNIFPGILSSTKDAISLAAGAVIKNGGKPLVTKKLIIAGAVMCDGGFCSKTNTLASKKEFTVDTGSGKDGSVNGSFGTVTSSKEYTSVTLAGAGVGTLEGDITIKIKDTFSFAGTGLLKVKGRVKIYADSAIIGGSAQLDIENGFLEIYANNITYGGTASGSDSQMALFSKNDIYFAGVANLKTLIYSDKSVTMGTGASIKGAITAKEIIISGAISAEYDEELVDEYCNIKPKPFTCSQEAYLFNGVPTDFYSIDLSNGEYNLLKNKIDDGYINGVGYNVKDNLIWGYNISTHKIVRIDSDYKVKSFDINIPEQSYFAGDVSQDGILYLKAHDDDKIYKIDLNSGYPESLGYISLSEKINFGDFAFNPIDGKLYSIGIENAELCQIDVSNGNIKKLGKIDLDEGVNFHTYVFDKDGNLYFYGQSGKIYKIYIGNGTKNNYDVELFTTTNINKAGGDGARCPNAEVPQPLSDDVCYAIDNVRNNFYTIPLSPGASNLPLATKKELDMSDVPASKRKDLDGQATAYDPDTGLVYAFKEENSPMYLYSIDPSNAKVTYLQEYPDMKKNIIAASFYGSYLYVIAKRDTDDATLYKIDKSDWNIKSTQDLSGATKDADALAINKDGEAYIWIDEVNNGKKDIFKIDLATAKTTLYKKDIYVYTDSEGMAFSKSGNVYIENSSYSKNDDTDKIYQLDLDSGDLIPAGQIPHSDDAAIEGLACNKVKTSSDIGFTLVAEPIYEGDSGTKNYEVTVRLDKAYDSDLTVYYSTEDGTAKTSDDDYQNKVGHIVIPKGETTGTIMIKVNGDIKVENDEYFYLNINVASVSKKVKLTIRNDDAKFLVREKDNKDNSDELQTQIVNDSFTYNIISVNEEKQPIENSVASGVKARLVDSSINCTNPNARGLTSWIDVDIENKVETSVVFNSSKAYRDVKVQLKWQDVNGNEKAVCSFDNFAIRPKKFDLILPSGDIVAGDNFTFTVKALDSLDNPATNYNERKNTSFKIRNRERKRGCNNGTLSLTQNRFSDGDFTDTSARYSDVGEVDITIEEINGNEFAKVDSDDTNDTRRIIAKKTVRKRFIPAKFETIVNVTDAYPNMTFYSNTPATMGAKINVKVKAKNKRGAMLTNYKKVCYANDLNLTIFYTNSNTSDTQTLVSNKTILNTTTSPLSFTVTLPKTKFSTPTAIDDTKVNLSRNYTVAKNPNIFTVTKIVASDGSITTTQNITTNNKANFYYARAHAPSPQTTDNPILNANIYYEVYCKNCNKTTFPKANGKSSIDSVYWYILSSVPSGCNYGGLAISDSTVANFPVYIDPSHIKIVANKVPSKNRVKYEPSQPYLYYHKVPTTFPQKHYFNIAFTASNNTWAGEGAIGTTVDTNISKRPNQSLDW